MLFLRGRGVHRRGCAEGRDVLCCTGAVQEPLSNVRRSLMQTRGRLAIAALSPAAAKRVVQRSQREIAVVCVRIQGGDREGGRRRQQICSVEGQAARGR